MNLWQIQYLCPCCIAYYHGVARRAENYQSCNFLQCYMIAIFSKSNWKSATDDIIYIYTAHLAPYLPSGTLIIMYIAIYTVFRCWFCIQPHIDCVCTPACMPWPRSSMHIIVILHAIIFYNIYLVLHVLWLRDFNNKFMSFLCVSWPVAQPMYSCRLL